VTTDHAPDLHLDLVRELIGGSGGLCTVGVTRIDGTVHATVVNAGLLDHAAIAPAANGGPMVGFVARPGARKVRHLRARPRAALTFRVEWRWATVEGPVTLVGPGDPQPGIDADGLRRLLRDVYQACGGTHDDYEEFDRVMAREGRLAVLVRPERTLVNRPA
jgi:PPOX class probable F420-dependent enzyme